MAKSGGLVLPYFVRFHFPTGRLNLTSNFTASLNVRMLCQVDMKRAKKKFEEKKET